MIKLLDKFTSKYGIEADKIINGKAKGENERKCIRIIAYVLSSVYELGNEGASLILNRSQAEIEKYIVDVCLDFDYKRGEYDKMFNEILAIFEQAEKDGQIKLVDGEYVFEGVEGIMQS